MKGAPAIKHERIRYPKFFLLHAPNRQLWVQAPLPACLDTLPKLVTIEGQGSGRQGPPPLAPPEEPANA